MPAVGSDRIHELSIEVQVSRCYAASFHDRVNDWRVNLMDAKHGFGHSRAIITDEQSLARILPTMHELFICRASESQQRGMHDRLFRGINTPIHPADQFALQNAQFRDAPSLSAAAACENSSFPAFLIATRVVRTTAVSSRLTSLASCLLALFASTSRI